MQNCTCNSFAISCDDVTGHSPKVAIYSINLLALEFFF